MIRRDVAPALIALLFAACASEPARSPVVCKYPPAKPTPRPPAEVVAALRAVFEAKGDEEKERALAALDRLEVPKDFEVRRDALREASRAPEKSSPAVLSLSAYATSSEESRRVFRDEKAPPLVPWPDDGFVLAPSLPITGDNAPSFAAGRAQVLDLIARENRASGLDPDRLVVAGLSMGGALGYDIVSRHPDRFAGHACVSGGMPQQPTPLENLRTVEVLIMHGDKDDQVGLHVPRENAEKLKAIGVDHRLEILPGCGHEWPRRKEDGERLAAWLVSQRREPWPRELDLIFPAFPDSKDPKRRIYWLELPPQNKNRRATARVADNTITLGHCLEFKSVTLWLGEPLVDLDRPVTVRYEDGRRLFHGKLERSFRTLVSDLEGDGWDTSRAAPARLDVALPF